MASLGQSFVASELPVSDRNYEPLPDGWYNVIIHSAEIKTTKAGNGEFLAIRYDVTGPSHQGRIVFGNLNIKNPSSVAEEIGRQQLGSLMRAIGLASVQDSDQLIGNSLQIKLATRKSEGYEPANEVRDFKALDGTSSMPKATSTSPANNPPWAKK